MDIRLLAQIEPSTDKVVRLYTTIKSAADEMKIAPPAISQAIRLGGCSCKYKWEYKEINDKKILDLMNEENVN